MDESTKIPADKVDALAKQLQTSLQRRRPRPWLLVVAITLAAIGLLVLLAWWLYKPVAAPRLEVIALDVVAAVDESPRLVAQLALPDDDEQSLSGIRGRECVFAIRGREDKAVSDADGQATASWPPFEKPGDELISVRYVDVRNKQGSADQGRLFIWQRGCRILLVDVAETLAQVKPEEWAAKHGADISARADAARALQAADKGGYRVGYLAHTSSMLEYRKIRGWVGANRPATDRFPTGPVLPSADSVDLMERFGDVTVVLRTADAAKAASSAGAHVIVLDPAVKLAGVRSVPGWSDVVPLLDKKLEE